MFLVKGDFPPEGSEVEGFVLKVPERLEFGNGVEGLLLKAAMRLDFWGVGEGLPLKAAKRLDFGDVVQLCRLITLVTGRDC